MQTPLFTRTLTDADSPFELTQNDGISKYSFKVTTGTCTLLGTKIIGGTIQPNAITFEEGETFSDSSGASLCCITLTIAPGAVVRFAASTP